MGQAEADSRLLSGSCGGQHGWVSWLRKLSGSLRDSATLPRVSTDEKRLCVGLSSVLSVSTPTRLSPCSASVGGRGGHQEGKRPAMRIWGCLQGEA